MSDVSRHKAIRTILAADATLAALVTDTVDGAAIVKIRPGALADTDAPPGIIIDVPADANADDLDGSDDAGGARVEIACIAYTRELSHQIGVEVKRVLNGFRGDAGGLMVDPASYRGAESSEEFPDDDSVDDHVWHITTLQFDVWYRTA